MLLNYLPQARHHDEQCLDPDGDTANDAKGCLGAGEVALKHSA